ncbi:hypothetical protein [Phenylobacterium sp.]|uniref:hypothetical protein n=1 Tax=Phenylobacterium sp. TaxID=1871053 RepID=UPI00398310CA
MKSALHDKALRPFNPSGYEIFGGRLASCGDVVIWSVDPLIPRLGDLFTIERAGRVHHVAVRELTTFRGGWSATCQREV